MCVSRRAVKMSMWAGGDDDGREGFVCDGGGEVDLFAVCPLPSFSCHPVLRQLWPMTAETMPTLCGFAPGSRGATRDDALSGALRVVAAAAWAAEMTQEWPAGTTAATDTTSIAVQPPRDIVGANSGGMTMGAAPVCEFLPSPRPRR